ncbi:hypothetical protein FQR65_LT02252 [Abscondita terminalis]|nr:hypothetical protein FQR65_LT02252 [Abscondita terminalis]
MLFFEILILIITIGLVALYAQWKYSYWHKRNIPYLTPVFPFGNAENPLTRKYYFGLWLQNLYNYFKQRGDKQAGLYFFSRPVYFPIEPDFIKDVMSKDFQFFVDRGFYYNEKDDPLSAHLFAIGGQKWRDLRTKLTPTFTSGKMKSMLGTLNECTNGMKEFVGEKYENKEPLNIKNVLERFTIDVIGSCAFGIECNSFKSTNAEFQKHGMEVFKSHTKYETLKVMFCSAKPELARSLGITTLPQSATSFFLNVVKETVNYRETNNLRRNDMLQILIDLKSDNKMVLSIEEIAAQAFVFFLAGFETSSTTMTFCLYELSINPSLQDKVREEIVSVLGKHGNKITYEAIMEMKYMQQVIDETLRKYPPVAFLTRECVKDYPLPNTDTVIEKGTMVMISVIGLHRDSEYYENPEKFDPERFSENNKHNVRPFTYIPFGEGPRLCLGMRFGLMETKVGLITLLKDYKFSLNTKTKEPLVWDRFSFILTSETPIWLNINKI